MNKSPFQRYPYAGVGLILLSIAAVYTVFSFMVPPAVDDIMYITRWNRATGYGEFSLKGFFSFIKNSRIIDNFRIANFFNPLFLIFHPFKDLFPFLNAVMVAAMVYLSARISSIGLRLSGVARCLLLTFTWVLMIVFVPWEYIFILDYSFNYIWATAISLGFLLSFFGLLRSNSGKWQLGVCLFLAVVAGGWHEGFALSTFCGICLFILSRKGKLPLKFYIALALFAASAVFFGWSPGIRNRVADTMGGFNFNNSVWVALIILILAAYVLFLLTFARGRRLLGRCFKSPVMTVGTGIIVSGCLLSILTDNSDRCYFWANVAAITMLVYLLIRSGFKPLKKRWKILACCILYGLCVAQSVFTICVQAELKKENDIMMKALADSEVGMVYHDIKLPEKVPFLCFNMPVTHLTWQSSWQYLTLLLYHKKPFMSIVPTEFRVIEASGLKPLGRNSDFFYYRDYLLSESRKILEKVYFHYLPFAVDMDLKYQDGRSATIEVLAYPFITQKATPDGTLLPPDTLLYYKLPPSLLPNIESVNVTPL